MTREQEKELLYLYTQGYRDLCRKIGKQLSDRGLAATALMAAAVKEFSEIYGPEQTLKWLKQYAEEAEKEIRKLQQAALN